VEAVLIVVCLYLPAHLLLRRFFSNARTGNENG
jgi:hypothetical protein